MSHWSARITRRKLLQTTAVGAAAATAVVNAPSVLRAQGSAVKLGVLHPVSGALSYSGQQGRLGATIAIDEINAAGGIKALGGARGCARRRAVDAGRRQRRGREDERGR